MVLHGYPTGLIALVSLPSEIPTVAVLHHPFLFGEIPMYFKQTSKGISGAVAGKTIMVRTKSDSKNRGYV